MIRSDPQAVAPTSHHAIGVGPMTEGLAAAARDPEDLLLRLGGEVDACGLAVIAQQAVPFTGGGLTLVWVLAESHLVLHLWPEEGYATIDLHVCDYRASNAAKAERLRERLDRFCFVPGGGGWRAMTVDGAAEGRALEAIPD